MKITLLRYYSSFGKVFIAYFPVILVACQVLVNLTYFFANDFYNNNGRWLNAWFGSNVLVSLFLIFFTHKYKFCSVSKWAARAEILFAINYEIVQQDNLYNIMFQVIVGSIALGLTFWHYIKKFPLCNFSLAIRFYKYVVKEKSCSKGYKRMENYLKHRPNNAAHGRYT